MWVCICHPLTEEDVRRLVQDNRIENLQQLVSSTAAATGCGCCRDQLKIIFERVLEQSKQV